MKKNHRPPLSHYMERIMVIKRLPTENGYYKVCLIGSLQIVDRLFITDDLSKEDWQRNVEWWIENIPAPFALTAKEAWKKLMQDPEYLKKILECNFVGAKQRGRIPTDQEIQQLRNEIEKFC